MKADMDTLVIERLNPFTAQPFSHLCFPSHVHLFCRLHTDGTVIAVGAFADGRPVGLAMAKLNGLQSEILSVCVSTPFRSRGLGTRLLLEAEAVLRERGAQKASFIYVTCKPITPAVERILDKAQWPAPAPKHLVCTSDKRMYEAPWMAEYKLSARFEIFAWTELTERDRESLLRSQAAENWVPRSLWPFSYDKFMEAANSLGVRHNGELVGWVITQPREPNAICYACSYMRPNLQRRGYLVAAYAEAVRRQIEFTDKPIGIWIVPYIQGPMAAFVLRRMKPYLISLSEFKEAHKVFTPVSEEPSVLRC